MDMVILDVMDDVFYPKEDTLKVSCWYLYWKWVKKFIWVGRWSVVGWWFLCLSRSAQADQSNLQPVKVLWKCVYMYVCMF